jgi:hypothetical protein
MGLGSGLGVAKEEEMVGEVLELVSASVWELVKNH